MNAFIHSFITYFRMLVHVHKACVPPTCATLCLCPYVRSSLQPLAGLLALVGITAAMTKLGSHRQAPPSPPPTTYTIIVLYGTEVLISAIIIIIIIKRCSGVDTLPDTVYPVLNPDTGTEPIEKQTRPTRITHDPAKRPRSGWGMTSACQLVLRLLVPACLRIRRTRPCGPGWV